MDVYVFQQLDGPSYDLSTITQLSTALSKPDITIRKIAKWELQAAEVYLYYYMTSQDCPQDMNAYSILLDANEDIIHTTMQLSVQKNTVVDEPVYINCMMRIHATMMQFVKIPEQRTAEALALQCFNVITTHMYEEAVSETDICGTSTLRTIAGCMSNIARKDIFHSMAQALEPEGSVYSLSSTSSFSGEDSLNVQPLTIRDAAPASPAVPAVPAVSTLNLTSC